MPVDTSILLAVLGAGVAAATFFAGRQSAARHGGQEWGELLADVRFIKESLREMKAHLHTEAQELHEEIAREREERGQSIRRLHEKMDAQYG